MFARAVAELTIDTDTMKHTLKHTLGLIGIAATLILTGCSTTQFTSTYKAPDAKPLHIASGSKVGALVIYPEVSVVRSAEDALAAQLSQRGILGMPAYSILGSTDPGDPKAVRSAFEKAGATALVVMRGVAETTQTIFRDPTIYTTPPYRAFWGGYYDSNWEPNLVRRDDPTSDFTTGKVVSVETLVYDLKTNKLVWSGHSRTVEPSNLATLMNDIVDEVAKQMKKDGVI